MNNTITINTSTLQLEILEAERLADRNRMVLSLHQQVLEQKGQLAERDATIAQLTERLVAHGATITKSADPGSKQPAGGPKK